MSDWIEIGKIVAAQGLGGEVRVYPNSDFPERFLEPGTRWLQKPGEAEPQPVELLGGWVIPGKGLYAIELAGVDTRDRAEALRDSHLLIPEGDRPHLEEGEFYVLDLLGLEVFRESGGEAIGTVTDVIPAGNDLLEVQLNVAPTEEELAADAALQAKLEKIPKNKRRKRHFRQKASKPKTVLIPFVAEIVPVVDLENRRLEITPPDGLLE